MIAIFHVLGHRVLSIYVIVDNALSKAWLLPILEYSDLLEVGGLLVV